MAVGEAPPLPSLAYKIAQSALNQSWRDARNIPDTENNAASE